MKKRNNIAIILKRLTLKEHLEIFQLSRSGLVFSNFLQDLQLNEIASVAFTQRLLWLSKGHYTVRIQDQPKKVIGYALFYKMGKSYQDGLCLQPEYVYPDIMAQIHEQLRELAKFCYGIHLSINCLFNLLPYSTYTAKEKNDFTSLAYIM